MRIVALTGAFLISFILSSCAEVSSVNNVNSADVQYLKEKVEQNEFISKQVLQSYVELKNSINEVNEQFRKQNQINEALASDIAYLKAKLSKQNDREEKKIENKDRKRVIGVVLNNLKLKDKPSSKGKVIANLKEGSIVEIEEEVGDWYKVRLSNNSGYVYKKSVTKVKQESENE